MDILSLGEKIKLKRKESGMTLKDLAGDRITPGQISLVESGKSNPSMDLLEYLASKLNVRVEYLIETEETQAEKVSIYYEDLAEFNILNKNFTIGENYLEKALFYAEKYNLYYRRARNFFLRATICISRDEMALAQQYLLSANGIFIKHNKFEDVVNIFLNLGMITLQLEAYHSALSYFQQAEKVYKNNDICDDFLIGQIYYYIAVSNFKLDNMESAINYSYLSKEILNQFDDKREYAKSLLLIAEEYSKMGDMDKAIKYSKKTIQAFKEINDYDYLGKIENDMGKLFYEFDNIEESFVHYNKAKNIRVKNKDKRLIETLINICENYVKMKDIDKAKDTLEEIKENIVNENSDALLAYYLLKFKIESIEGNIREAENTLVIALDFAKDIKNNSKAAEISIMLGKFYLDAKIDDKAVIYLNMGVELFKEQGILK